MASVESNFVLKALNKSTIGRLKPGRRHENNTKLEVRETEGKFGDCMKLVILRTVKHAIWLRD